MGSGRYMVAAGLIAAFLALPRLSLAVDDYCCVCTACPAPGQSVQCLTVLAADGANVAHCPERCAAIGCQFMQVLEDSCPLHIEECGVSTAAPASSAPVLAGVAVLLLAGGILALRRKRAVSRPVR